MAMFDHWLKTRSFEALSSYREDTTEKRNKKTYCKSPCTGRVFGKWNAIKYINCCLLYAIINIDQMAPDLTIFRVNHSLRMCQPRTNNQAPINTQHVDI